jgi:hypothetical protein
MSHVHKLLRDAIKTQLTGLASTGARVYANRLYELDDASLPALRLYLDQETVETDTISRPTSQSRSIQIVVECCAKLNSALDDACDQMQLEVENALYAGFTAGSRTHYPNLTGSAYDDAIGLTPVAVKRLAFSLDYFTLANAPDTFI